MTVGASPELIENRSFRSFKLLRESLTHKSQGKVHKALDPIESYTERNEACDRIPTFYSSLLSFRISDGMAAERRRRGEIQDENK